MDELALSDEARALDEQVVAPEDIVRPWNDFGHGRGLSLLLALAGLVSFFFPWVALTLPEDVVLRGFDLAQGRAGWLWGGATGYFVLLPLLWTRRSLARLRGVRVIATLFSSLTAGEVLVLLLFPPRRGLIPIELEWQWGLYVSGAISALATLAALRLGSPLFGRSRRAELPPGPLPEEPRVLH